jgi:hypothetical protein
MSRNILQLDSRFTLSLSAVRDNRLAQRHFVLQDARDMRAHPVVQDLATPGAIQL